MFTKALLIGSLLASASVARVDLLYSQPWDLSPDLHSSQHDPITYGHFSTAYADFMRTSESMLTGFNVNGGFFNGCEVPIHDYTLTLCADAGGAPCAVIMSGIHSGTSTLVALSDCVPHLEYGIAFLPYAIDPGTYWLSVVADVLFPPERGLAASAVGSGNAVVDFVDSRTQLVGTDLAFDVLVTSAAPVAATHAGCESL
jgi:hypothetical protein